jgi:hypothetical protein
MALVFHKRVFGHSWGHTDTLDEVPDKIRAAIVKETGLDPSLEKVLSVSFVDTLGSRGNFFIVVTDDRVLTKNPSGVTQALFKDVRTVEQAPANVKIRSYHNEFSLFHTLVTPKSVLAEQLFGIVNRQWLAARKR